MTICYIVAIQAETQPFIEKYNVQENEGFFAPMPFRLFTTTVGSNTLHIVINGKQHESNLVGCEAAAITTMAVIQRLNPDIIINSGTCGAFRSDGADIADVYIGNGVMFHDRRVPGDDAWFTQSVGNYPVYEKSELLASALGFKCGKVTTGSSLDMQPCDLEIIKQHGGQLKDMEGAAIAFVCSLLNVPVMFVKSVTDLCDHTADTYEDFQRNLAAACLSLRYANEKVIEYLFEYGL